MEKGMMTDGGKLKGRLIPEGELKCVWMTAGVVSYKLCNLSFNCETCPFDQAMRGQREQLSAEAEPSEELIYLTSAPDPLSTQDGQDPVERTFNSIFRDLRDIRIRKQYLYHHGHTWVDCDTPPMARLGIDDFAGRCLHGIKTVIFPARRNRIDQGQVCCWFVTEGGTLPILSPLTGTIIDTNPLVPQNRDLVSKHPYDRGWLMQVEAEDLPHDMKSLYGESEACARCQTDVGKLKETFRSLLADSMGQLGPTLCDGGNVPIHLWDIVGPKRFFDIIKDFFTGR